MFTSQINFLRCAFNLRIKRFIGIIFIINHNKNEYILRGKGGNQYAESNIGDDTKYGKYSQETSCIGRNHIFTGNPA